MEALGTWLYSIRRWSEGGHSRQELHKENTDPHYITYTGRSQEIKETVDAALAQIEEKQYVTSLTAKGIPESKIRK